MELYSSVQGVYSLEEVSVVPEPGGYDLLRKDPALLPERIMC
jgi:hypothetical protein